MRIEKQKAFTLIELLVVIAVIALLMAVIIPALGKAKAYAQRIICANNIRQQALGAVLYSDENDSYVPCPLPYSITGKGPTATVTIGGGWFWDISFWFTNQLCEYAGFEKSDSSVFTCPANKMRKPNDALWWQFSWTAGGPSPVSPQDENTLSMAQQRINFRVGPYIYLFDRYVFEKDQRSLYDPACTIPSGLPEKTETGREMKDLVVRKLSNAKAAGSMRMIMDAIISNSNNWEFSGLTNGGIWSLSQQTLTDDTNHLSRQRVSNGTKEGPKPAGMNIAFADAHVEWQGAGNYNMSTGQFENIRLQYKYGEWFWW